jgi:hypothetical protein
MPIVMGLGSGIALFQGTFHYLGGRYDSFKREGDEFERKEIVRRSTRLPIEQTISEIGEGRGKSRTVFDSGIQQLTHQQASDLLVMRNDGRSDLVRSTVLRLTPSRRLSRVANKHETTRRRTGRERLYITLLGEEEMLH